MKKMMSNSPSFFFLIVVVCVAAAAAVSAAGREDPPYDHVIDHLSSLDEIFRMSGYGEEKLSTVLITGTLTCTSCSSDDPHHLRPLPISGALVAASCNSNSMYTKGSKKPTWEKGVTDENGEFIIDLPSHLHAIPNLHKACSIKVLWLPKDAPCKSASVKDKDRVNEIVLSSVGNGIRTYTARTIQFLDKETENPEACKRMAMEVTQEMSW